MTRIIRILCVCIIALSCVQFFRISRAQRLAQSAFQELRETYQTEESGAPAEPPQTADLSDAAMEASPPEQQTPETDPRLEELLARNADFVGWLTIEDTRIDYPIVCSPQKPEYYLNHDFDGSPSYCGVPFMDAACDLQESENLIIYGHNMRNGTMFYDLSRFTKAEFCEQNPLITFDTITGHTTWQVVTVFKIAERDTRRFPYHQVTEFSPDTQTAADYLSRCSYYAIWTDDALPEDDAELLTLSTCEYSLKNGRLVVVAKRIR